MKRDKEKTDNFIDDGRTVADMSGISKKSLFGGRMNAEDWEKADEMEAERLSYAEDMKYRPWEKKDLSRTEKAALVLGALKASLLIWLAFVVGLGGFILILTLVFKAILE